MFERQRHTMQKTFSFSNWKIPGLGGAASDAGSTTGASGSGSASGAASTSGEGSFWSRLVTPETDVEEQGMMSELCSLSRTQRLYAFLFCFSVGWLLTGLALLFLPVIILKPAKFASMYTIGSVLSMASTIFLVGPKKQMENMFKEKRRYASIAYIASMVLTLVVVFGTSGIIRYVLCFALLAVQFCAMLYYTASYIPFAKEILKSSFKKLLGCCGLTSSSVDEAIFG